METQPLIRQDWLDWRQPALAAVAALLCDRYAQGRNLDLGQLLVVTPGLRSRHRLLELLLDAAAAQRLVLTPPEFVAVEALPARLLPEPLPFATPVESSLAWLRAIAGSDRSWLPQRGPEPFNTERVADWLPWVQLLQRLHRELASEGLLFADLRRSLAERRLFPDAATAARWENLAQVQQAYFAQLSQWGRVDRQQACLAATAARRCVLDRELYLVGTVDLRPAIRAMLAQVAARVHPVILADPQHHQRFDEFGCLRTAEWMTAPLDLRDEWIRIVDRPIDQAAAVLEVLANLPQPVAAEAVTIGVPDLRVVPHLERRLQGVGLATRRLAGKPLAETLLVRLLAATGDFLESEGFVEFAAWVRHPDLFDWLVRAGVDATLLNELDRWQNEVLPQRVELRWARTLPGWPRVAAAADAAQRLVAPLQGKPRPLPAWFAAIREFLGQVYAETPLDQSSPAAVELVAAAEVLREHCETLQQIPADDLPLVTAVDAIRFVLESLAHESVPAPAVPGGVELAGWLDLPLDDAAVTIVTSFNDELIPSAVTADAFLNNSIRQELGLIDNAHRYARDAYHLALLAASGRHLALIACRHDTAHDPLLPSRLLFAADDEALRRRAQAFFDFSGPAQDGLWLVPASPPEGPALPRQQQWPIPLPRAEWARVTQLRVTDFKQFLQCPYRFFLSRVLRLQALSDDWQELPPYVFGQLAHDVLEAFARGAAVGADDPAEIERFLIATLDQVAEHRYGRVPAAAVRIQIEQVRQRLVAFAAQQAAWRREGWLIVAAEVSDLEHWLDVDGQPFRIYGRIDRIDRNERDGTFAIFDYKTADSAKTPDQTHRTAGAWTDLQLPLYRHLARHQFPELRGPCRLGYVLLPRSLGEVEFAQAPWSEEDLAAADETAREVIRRVRRGEFWPPADPPPYPDSEWVGICQERVAERWPFVAASGTGPPV